METLRGLAIVLAWVTVGGGALMATIWLARGGATAVGPEDEQAVESGIDVRPRGRRITSFSSAHVGVHGLLGVLTASLLTYGMLRDDDRTTGYLAIVAAIVVTATLGALLYRRWHSGRRPDVPDLDPQTRRQRVEDDLPKVVVLGHGVAAVATAALVLVLLIGD